MIYYDSHKCLTFCKVRGSIFPKAVLWAMPSAVSAYLMKLFGLFDLKSVASDFPSGSGTIYSGFTFVLGFVLVFRTSQSYIRYWSAATAAHSMRAEWLDACASLIAFVQSSKKPKKDINVFAHTTVRLFGLMHAMALEEIASLEDENFPLLDIQGLEKEQLMVLTSEAAQGRKVEIVCQWIKMLIISAIEDGLLTTPPPILTRVFQELGTGLVHYHEAVQVVIWPFPFPYAQMSAVMIFLYMLVTPLVINLWAQQAWYCGIATLISVVCMKGIDMIAIELENPFGDDPNDLPCFEMHHDMNRDLALLVNPATWSVPKLGASARMTYDGLVALNEDNRLSLDQYHKKLQSAERAMSKLQQIGPSLKQQKQDSWAQNKWKSSSNRVIRVLDLKPAMPREPLTKSEEFRSEDNMCREEKEDASEVALTVTMPVLKTWQREVHVHQKLKQQERDLTKGTSRGSTAETEQPWGDFLLELSGRLSEHLRHQLEQQEAVYERTVLAAGELVRERHMLEFTRHKSSKSSSTQIEAAAQMPPAYEAPLPGAPDEWSAVGAVNTELT